MSAPSPGLVPGLSAAWIAVALLGIAQGTAPLALAVIAAAAGYGLGLVVFAGCSVAAAAIGARALASSEHRAPASGLSGDQPPDVRVPRRRTRHVAVRNTTANTPRISQ